MRELRSCATTVFNHAVRYPTLLAMLVYLILDTLLTWPLLLKPSSVLFGDYGDSRGTVWWVWANKNGFDSVVNHMIAAPFGVPAERGFSQPVTESLLVMLARLSNEICAYNIFVVLAFYLTALATYICMDKLLNNKVAAFVAGVVFGFCPAAVMQATAGHAAFAFNVFIPLFLMALFYNRSRRSLLSVSYVAVSFSLITFTALYFGYFAIYIAIMFVFFDLSNNNISNRPNIVLNYLYCAIFAAILILPVEYQAIYQQIGMSKDALVKAGHVRDFSELIAYSSRPWDFFVPSIDHPVIGKLFYDFARNHLHGSNIPEQALYLGLVPVSLFMFGIACVIRGKFDTDHRRYFIFFAFGALWMFFLSLPPLIPIGDIQVPTFSWFSYRIAPMFRVYARFGILVSFFMACADAVVLAHLFQGMKRTRYIALISMLLPVLYFDYWTIPPGYALPVNSAPEVYQWLAKSPEDVLIAEYPMMKSDEGPFSTYLFWQRIHKKRMVNGGAPSNSEAWNFYNKVSKLENSQTSALLKSVGVKYVIVHEAMYHEGIIPNPIKKYYPESVASSTYNDGHMPAIPMNLKLVKKFGTDYVFSLDGVSNGTN